MNHTAFVGVMHGPGDLGDDLGDGSRLDAIAQPLPQRRPVDIAQRDERLPPGMADFVDGAYMWMPQLRGRSGFAQETGFSFVFKLRRAES